MTTLTLAAMRDMRSRVTAEARTVEVLIPSEDRPDQVEKQTFTATFLLLDPDQQSAFQAAMAAAEQRNAYARVWDGEGQAAPFLYTIRGNPVPLFHSIHNKGLDGTEGGTAAEQRNRHLGELAWRCA
jgi:hypothetical protein